jgi:hypothetical protein
MGDWSIIVERYRSGVVRRREGPGVHELRTIVLVVLAAGAVICLIGVGVIIFGPR